jgi:hypothetical protein
LAEEEQLGAEEADADARRSKQVYIHSMKFRFRQKKKKKKKFGQFFKRIIFKKTYLKFYEFSFSPKKCSDNFLKE